MARLEIHDKLDKDIKYIQKYFFNRFGVKMSRPAAVEMLVKQYMRKGMPPLKRKPRSKEWEL